MVATDWSRTSGRAVGLAVGLGSVPIASAHGGHGGPPLPQWLALVALVAGVGIAAASAYARRRLSPTLALVGAFDGLLVAAVGAVGLVQLSPVASLAAGQPPLGGAWYRSLALGSGLAIAVGSLAAGRRRWPDRPRYAAVGILLGLWVAYPVLVPGALTNPAGYLLALSVPAAVGYVVRTDAGGLVRRALADRAARWFGAGTGALAAVLFAFSMGMVTFVPESGRGVDLTHDFVTTARVANPLVYWPAVEFHVHDAVGTVPVSGVVSVGMALLVGLIAVLVGLNGAVLAARWRASAAGGGTGATAGSAAIAAPNACCCCGPVLAELAVASVGPAAAAPLYWVFVDLASPVGALFFAASVALLAGNLVRAAGGSE